MNTKTKIITAVKTVQTSPESVQNWKQDTSYPNEIKHKLWEENDPRHKYVNYAYQKGWLDFVALLEAENWLWSIDRRSILLWANWYYDYWFCQVNKWYHPHIVNDSRFWNDWKWQIDRCHELYVWGTTFYWKRMVWKTKQRFIEKM